MVALIRGNFFDDANTGRLIEVFYHGNSRDTCPSVRSLSARGDGLVASLGVARPSLHSAVHQPNSGSLDVFLFPVEHNIPMRGEEYPYFLVPGNVTKIDIWDLVKRGSPGAFYSGQ